MNRIVRLLYQHGKQAFALICIKKTKMKPGILRTVTRDSWICESGRRSGFVSLLGLGVRTCAPFFSFWFCLYHFSSDVRNAVADYGYPCLHWKRSACTLAQLDLYQIVDSARGYSLAGENSISLLSGRLLYYLKFF